MKVCQWTRTNNDDDDADDDEDGEDDDDDDDADDNANDAGDDTDGDNDVDDNDDGELCGSSIGPGTGIGSRMGARFACLLIGTERAPGAAEAPEAKASAIGFETNQRSGTKTTRAAPFLAPQRVDGAKIRAPVAIASFRQLMKQQDATAQGGADSTANGDGGTTVPHIRGVTLATRVKA